MPPSDPSSPPTAKWRTSVVAPGRLKALAGILEAGETVQWAGAPDPYSAARALRWLWWLGPPWTAAALTLFFLGAIGGGWQFFAIAPGLALMAAPILLILQARGTTYAITDRRAIIKHDTVAKHQLVSIPFDAMDEKLEILAAGPDLGHLYFASGLSTRMSDVDYTGKLAFRDIAAPQAVAEVLEWARARKPVS
jgi:hypothetical protein